MSTGPTRALRGGRTPDDVLAELRSLREGDAPTRGGRTFAYVHDAGLDGLDELAAAASTAHAAFHKAAHYLGLETVVVPVDSVTFRADADAMAAALTDRTALVVASTPSYAHGVIDPVPEIAAAAARRGVLCPVDACIGGWLLPHLRRAGREVPPFDLSVPGVTSLSVDLRKYGYADKGASVVLYRDAELRRYQYFAHAGWPGYPVVNPTVQGTKSGGLLAQAWAVLQYVGEDGYTALAARVAEASDRLLAGLRGIDGLRVLGEPAAGLVAFTAGAPPGRRRRGRRCAGWRTGVRGGTRPQPPAEPRRRNAGARLVPAASSPSTACPPTCTSL